MSIILFIYCVFACALLQLSERDFTDSVLTSLAAGEELCDLLLQTYMTHQVEIRDILTNINMDLPHYHNLHWRLDIQVQKSSFIGTL